MPQLNPSPWFMVLIFSWFPFLTILLPTIMKFLFPGMLLFAILSTLNKQLWSWPWM